MQQGKKPQGSTLLLTTGGTIAGWAAQADAQAHYQAGALAGQALLAGLPPDVAGLPVVVDDFARINSKDADAGFWYRLYLRVQHYLADSSVAAIVVTHGTDTLEETAFFLSEVLPQPLPKPLIMVAAMRPASHRQADGPKNLADALRLAQDASCGQRGVLVICGGLVYAAGQLQKWHGSDIQPFVQRQAVQDALAVGAAAAWGVFMVGQVQWQLQKPCISDDFWQKSASNLPEQLFFLKRKAAPYGHSALHQNHRPRSTRCASIKPCPSHRIDGRNPRWAHQRFSPRRVLRGHAHQRRNRR